MKKYFFFFFYMEGSCVLLPADVMAQINICSHATTRQWMEIVCNMVKIVAAWNVALSQIMEFIAVKCWLVVQQGCKYVILAPLHINIKCVTCAFLSIVWRRMKM